MNSPFSMILESSGQPFQVERIGSILLKWLTDQI